MMHKEGIAREDRHSLFRHKDQQICLNITYVDLYLYFFNYLIQNYRKLESIAIFNLDLGQIQADLYRHWQK